ncbi:hypothetical protein GGF46_003002 [Coemansia sp. RSA 552]|nr:hypothetical protein GGF46_003002 [Coemansia sp. RSA 552]
MYGSGVNGTHSYAAPTAQSPGTNSQANDGGGKTAYDRDLASLFRSTAANVTQLYKEASAIGQNAYKAGYEQCYSDMWEFLLAAQDEGTLSSSSEHQQRRRVLLHQLSEFARLKQLSPRPTHVASTPGDRLDSVAPAANTDNYPCVSPVDSPGQVAAPTQQQQQQGSAAASPTTITETGANQAYARRTSADKPSDMLERRHDSLCNTPDRQYASDGGHPLRTKRMFDSLDTMDIEPPRRRQRREDVEMS